MAKVDLYPAFTASGVKVTSAVGDGPMGVRFEWPDGRAMFVDLPEHGMYLDACDVPGEPVAVPVAIVQGHDSDMAYLVRLGGWERLAKTHGIRAGAINVVNGQLRYVFVHNTREYIDTGEVKPLPPDQIQTSQGILALEPSGRINWAAPPDRVESGLYHKANAGEAAAGLLAAGDQLTVLNPHPHTIFNGLCHNIRIVLREDGTYGVCGRANDGSALFHVGPPWPAFVQPTPTVPRYHRPVAHFAYYTFDAGRGYGNHPEAVLHAAWCETQADVLEANKLGKPVVTSRELIGLATKKAFVMASNDFSGAEPLEDQIAAALPICLALECGLIVYDEHGEEPSNIPAWAVSAVRLFREPNEPIQQYIHRALLAISAVEQERVCGIFGVDDRAGTLTEAKVHETARVIPDIIREAERMSVAGFFSYARSAMQDAQHVKPGGGIVYPQAWAYVPASAEASDPIDWSAFTAPEEPIDPPDPPEPPEDNVNVYLPIPVAAPSAGQPNKPGKLHLVGERVNQPDGGFAIKATNGKWTTLRDNGTWDTSATEIREWERFYDGKPGFTIAPNRGDATYYVETVQGP